MTHFLQDLLRQPDERVLALLDSDIRQQLQTAAATGRAARHVYPTGNRVHQFKTIRHLCRSGPSKWLQTVRFRPIEYWVKNGICEHVWNSNHLDSIHMAAWGIVGGRVWIRFGKSAGPKKPPAV